MIHQEFVAKIYEYYAQHKRFFPWRETNDPYHILVSEIMLQQTQTDRVLKKYDHFIATFPSIMHLAKAAVASVITAWQGLGYNRRALGLHDTAQRIVLEYKGLVPEEPCILEQFKSIGPSTAASIVAFAYNKPTIFIETNIRTVFIHTFFKGKMGIVDAQLFPLIVQTIDKENPRQWYYALMDYGVMLKKLHKNPSRQSAHHSIQSKFEGSDRQVRGTILKLLTQVAIAPQSLFFEHIARESDTIARILKDLEKEGFIEQNNNLYFLAR